MDLIRPKIRIVSPTYDILCEAIDKKIEKMSSSPFQVVNELTRSMIVGAGFSTELWVPEFGWSQCERRQDDADEASASDEPYPLQALAAMKVFVSMFCDLSLWVHLAAEMQAGKTGVINALLRLILSNSRRIGITPNRMFVLTGMSDDDWQEQTSKRLPKLLRENVHHSGTLAKVKAKLEALAEDEDDKQLRNVLIALDESHHAASSSNRPNTMVYQVVARLCPRHLWSERNIRFLTVSATDPAKVLAMEGSEPAETAVVRLETTEAYQSVQSLRELGRLRPVEKVLHEAAGAEILCNQVRALEMIHGPLVHILRPNAKKGKDMNEVVEALLKERIKDCIVVPWDLESKKRRSKEASESASTASTDINSAYLSAKPTKTTFILLKGMFRAAKTLNDAHVGVLYDRVGGADSTNLQSLLGRACGYGKSSRSIVFVANSTVENYVSLWRELCASRTFPKITDIPVASLKGKMPGVASKKKQNASVLVLKENSACPISTASGAGAGGQDVAVASGRKPHNEEDFIVEWSQEFLTAQEAKELTGAKKMEHLESGFYRNVSGKKTPMSREQYIAFRGGKNTAHVGKSLDSLKVGDKNKRTIAFYENTMDATTVRFVVRTLTRRA
jgi:hypothetical protein